MLDLESGRATVFFMTQHTTESSSLFGTEIAPQFKSVKNEKELRGWLSRISLVSARISIWAINRLLDPHRKSA